MSRPSYWIVWAMACGLSFWGGSVSFKAWAITVAACMLATVAISIGKETAK